LEARSAVCDFDTKGGAIGGATLLTVKTMNRPVVVASEDFQL
jgi:hypothetical protein